MYEARKKEMEPVFPPEFAHLESLLRDAQKEMASIDQQKESWPRDKGLTLTFSPPGGKNLDDTGKHAKRMERLDRFKSDIKRKFDRTLARELANVEAKTASQIRQIANHQVSDNQFKSLGRTDLKSYRDEIKKAPDSFDFMASLHYNRFNDQPSKQMSEPDKAENIQDVSRPDATDRFLSMISRHQEGKNEQSIEPEKDDVGLEEI